MRVGCQRDSKRWKREDEGKVGCVADSRKKRLLAIGEAEE